ncbi:pantetheine-phosphate adenylyltransferase [Mesoplasma photuris]|uniref:pantetheine-phosphate adenylyltransferase n=1 Tax=Mesoplasma photuris TaxID=217731 RepID=UPI0004E15D02|nr:pantetheine-phosphate adenylyltransferase [Mesoplasma photuris]
MKAIYPGSFDPIHEGHLNIIKKATNIFDEVIIVITKNINKTAKKSLEERQKNVENMIKDLKNIEVMVNADMLTIDFANKVNAKFIIRGLRGDEDFKNEIKMYDANKYLDQSIETIYLISDEEKRQISSSSLNEINSYKLK